MARRKISNRMNRDEGTYHWSHIPYSSHRWWYLDLVSTIYTCVKALRWMETVPMQPSVRKIVLYISHLGPSSHKNFLLKAINSKWNIQMDHHVNMVSVTKWWMVKVMKVVLWNVPFGSFPNLPTLSKNVSVYVLVFLIFYYLEYSSVWNFKSISYERPTYAIVVYSFSITLITV